MISGCTSGPPIQAAVRLVRQNSAQAAVTVTESKMLRDAVLDIECELDIVIEGKFDGEPMVISVEVIELVRRSVRPNGLPALTASSAEGPWRLRSRLTVTNPIFHLAGVLPLT
jgi:hypothetical protein